ncbi:MAG: hypothetical protein ABI548_01645 [Polyangiaceae bacterium]
MLQIEFENIQASTGARGAALVGDAIGDIIGKPNGVYPALSFNVTAQPAGSDIFSAGSNVSWATAIAATLSAPGWHEFTAAAGDVAIFKFAIVVWPAAVLNYEPIKQESLGVPRSSIAQRAILRALASHASKVGAQATLEGGAAVAPWYGARPDKLNPARLDAGVTLRAFGAY